MQKIEATSPEAQSADLLKANIEQLKKLFPELLTESANGVAVNVDVLKALVGDQTATDADEKYGLNWHGKRRARQLALTPSTGTLRPCPDESVDWDTTQNLMIEGDNLEVLKLLQKSYAGKVKLIYIDPPYNTGKDFVYPDNFQDNIKNYLELTGQTEGGAKISSNTEASGRFHTDWLNMIYPRIKLARSLMTLDGVILISIDEHEITNTRRVMDEVFGEENFLSCVTWEKGRKNDAKFFSNGHEYVVVYAKSQAYLREQKTLWREEKPGARDIWDYYQMLRGKYGEQENLIERDLQIWYASLPKSNPAKKWSRYKRIDRHGPWRDRDISWPGSGGPKYDLLHPVTKLPCKVPEAGWRFSSPQEMQRQIDLGLVEFRVDHTEPPFRKAHIRPIQEELESDEVSGDNDIDDVPGEVKADDDEFATQVRGSYFYKQSQVSVKYLRSLFGKKVFNNPKDLDEIARLIRYTTSDDPHAVVLDFFAGSGTSGEAVIRLNSEDHGNRRFIVVQIPEPLDATDKEQKIGAAFCDELKKPRTIAELTKERLRRAATKIRASNIGQTGATAQLSLEDSTQPPATLPDLGFRVFKLDHSNIRAWNPKPDDLAQAVLDYQDNLTAGRTESDILYELLLKLGLDLCVPIATRQIAGLTVHAVGGGVMMACLAPAIASTEVDALATGIVAWRKELAPAGDTTCVFRDSAFADDIAKTNLTAILEQNGIQNVRSL